MLDFHVEQGRQIKAAVDALGLENAAARELLARLKDNELRLKHTLNDLAREMEHMKATKSAQFKDVVVRGEMVLNDIQTKHTLEKQNIQTQKQVLQVTLDSKLNDINHIGIINTHIDSEIKDVSQHANKLKSEADHHHIRATSAELEKRANVEREHAEKVAEINKLNRDHAFNKSVIGGHMENVNREIVHRQGDINVTSESLNRNEYERHNQVLKKSHLERSLNSYIAQYDITRKSQAIELNNRTNAQNIHLQNVDNVGKIHEHGMKETINNTTSVYEDHRRRVEDAVVRNNNFQDRLAHTINEERQLGHEANHWLRTAHEVERVKNIELSNSLERKRVQVGHLTNSIIHERNSINNANNTLVSSINHKEATNSGIRLQNVQTSNLINSTVHES